MRDLLIDMFWAPEAQGDPYAWAAVLLAHAAIGAVLVAAAGCALAAAVILITGIRRQQCRH